MTVSCAVHLCEEFFQMYIFGSLQGGGEICYVVTSLSYYAVRSDELCIFMSEESGIDRARENIMSVQFLWTAELLDHC